MSISFDSYALMMLGIYIRLDMYTRMKNYTDHHCSIKINTKRHTQTPGAW